MMPTFRYIVILMLISLYIVILILISLPVQAARLSPERSYQEAWCTADVGQSEFILPDRTRVDCLTDEYAIEFDFADKWAESIGQALYYAAETGKKPGIVLIIENGESDLKYIQRLKRAIDRSGTTIKVWFITP